MPATLDRLRFFTDTPDLSGETFPASVDVAPDTDAPPTSTVQIAKTGTFVHPISGKAVITTATFDSMIRNFDAGIPTDRLPVDYDHSPETRGDTRACGWIVGLSQQDGKLYAEVEWTWGGAFSVRDREYRYVSISWTRNLVADDQSRHGPALYGLALTNRPFLESMAPVSLSATFQADEYTLAEEVCEDAGEPSDSRPGMSDFATFAKALGLKDDADEAAIVAAIEAKDTATFAGHQTLEDAAKAEGKVVFSQADADKLRADKDAATTAADKLQEDVDALKARDSDRSFRRIFDGALHDPKGARVAPAEEEDMRALFDVRGEEKFEAYLKGRTPVVNGSAKGGRGDETDAPENADPESFDIDREAKSYMAEHKRDYRDAVFAVAHQREQAQR